MDDIKLGGVLDVARLQTLDVRNCGEDSFDNENFHTARCDIHVNSKRETRAHDGSDDHVAPHRRRVRFDRAERVIAMLINLHACKCMSTGFVRLGLEFECELLVGIIARLERVTVTVCRHNGFRVNELE